jgi:hypothetical protein
MQVARLRWLIARTRNQLSVLIRIGVPTLVAVARLVRVLVAERLWRVPPRPRREAQPVATVQMGALG